MSRKLGYLIDAAENSLCRSKAGFASLSSIDAYDKKFRNDLIRWLTTPGSKVSRFSKAGIQSSDWRDVARAQVICDVVEARTPHTDATSSKLTSMRSWLAKRQEEMARTKP